MSSFKRKTQANQQVLPGTRISPISNSTLITSTGIPSLDDILGGGIPLSCTSLLLAPDSHSSYGDLVQKYFIAQGLASQQDVWVVGEKEASTQMLGECMWLADNEKTGTIPTTSSPIKTDVEEEGDGDEKIKIAWRYGGMRKFQTTVESSSAGAALNYVSTFDLSRTLPQEILQQSVNCGRLLILDPSDPEDATTQDLKSSKSLLIRIRDLLSRLKQESQQPSVSRAVRICVPRLGCPAWGSPSDSDILGFLHGLRSLLRQYTFACASIGLPAYMSTDTWSHRPGWTQKLSWLSDSALLMSAFSADPSLALAFPAHHGMVRIHSLPSPHALLPASDKLSILRGVQASSSSDGSFVGGGENNLAFKCTRKKLVFETLHLDVEGGVGERRTKPSEVAQITGQLGSDSVPPASRRERVEAAVEIKMEGAVSHAGTVQVQESHVPEEPASKLKKAKKKVAFRSERPELYDF